MFYRKCLNLRAELEKERNRNFPCFWNVLIHNMYTSLLGHLYQLVWKFYCTLGTNKHPPYGSEHKRRKRGIATKSDAVFTLNDTGPVPRCTCRGSNWQPFFQKRVFRKLSHEPTLVVSFVRSLPHTIQKKQFTVITVTFFHAGRLVYN